MARPRTSRGFTLVELLVVITIIGMLVSLLLPAIQSAREAGRRTTCMNNMRQAATALTVFEAAQKRFPGYVSAIQKDNGTFRASWVVEILGNLEQNALYQNWKNPAMPLQWDSSMMATYNRAQYIAQIPSLLCPSNANPDFNDDALHFVINTGSALTANDNLNPPYSSPNWPEDSSSGIAFNQARGDYPAMAYTWGAKKVNMDFLTSNDGSTNTLLLSENLQAGGWATEPANETFPYQTDFSARQSVGLVWFLTGRQDNAGNPTPLPLAGGYQQGALGINDMAQAVSGLPKRPYDAMNLSTPTGLAFCRPSSYHPGGVNAMFCGGNNRFLSDQMDYKVYTQLMTGHQAQVIVDYVMGNPIRANAMNGTIQMPASSGGPNAVPVPWGYILNEADL